MDRVIKSKLKELGLINYNHDYIVWTGYPDENNRFNDVLSVRQDEDGTYSCWNWDVNCKPPNKQKMIQRDNIPTEEIIDYVKQRLIEITITNQNK